MAKHTDLRELVARVDAMPVYQRLLLAGQLVQQGDPSLIDLAMVIAENVVLDWKAMKVLGRRG